jgi:hypothetical protein
MDERAIVILLALVLAPWPLVILGAIVRGYDISLTMRRRRQRRHMGE